MYLSGPEILKEMERGNIVIDPFRKEAVNPNSVNLRLGPKLLTYDLGGRFNLDMALDNPYRELSIPRGGMVLLPDTLYIGHTLEYTLTRGFVPVIEGRSSVARLGMSVHLTAGFGDVGFEGDFTLEITVVHPLRVYAGVDICQIAYLTLQGDITPYRGRYQCLRGPQSSRMWQNLRRETL